MKLHSAEEIIDMLRILCQKIFSREEKNKVILPRSGGNLRKWYPCDLEQAARCQWTFRGKIGI